MDTQSLRCKIMFIKNAPPVNPERYLFLEQIICPGEKMRRQERQQLCRHSLPPGQHLTRLQFQQCSICLVDFRKGDDLLRMPNCTHYFHQYCLDIWLKDSSATCPVCRRNARIRHVLCYRLTSPEQMTNAAAHLTSASAILLLKSVLEPKFENSKKNVSAETTIHHQDRNSSEEINHAVNFTLQINVVDPNMEIFHRKVQAIFSLANDPHDMSTQYEQISMEFSFAKQYLELLNKSSPEPQHTYPPPYHYYNNYNVFHHGSGQRLFHSVDSEESFHDTLSPMQTVATVEHSILLLHSRNIRRLRRQRQMENATRRCISVEVHGSYTDQVFKYLFHAPTEDCRHNGHFYLEHLDSSSNECMTAQRYIVCAPLVESQGTP